MHNLLALLKAENERAYSALRSMGIVFDGTDSQLDRVWNEVDRKHPEATFVLEWLRGMY